MLKRVFSEVWAIEGPLHKVRTLKISKAARGVVDRALEDFTEEGESFICVSTRASIVDSSFFHILDLFN